MHRRKIIIASSGPISRARLGKTLAAIPGYEVIASASDLSATFTLAEAKEPDLVILASDLCRVPEFEGMRSLFYALDAKWIELVPDLRAHVAVSKRLPSGQIWRDPVIDLNMPVDQLCAEIERVLAFGRNTGKRPAPGQPQAVAQGPQRLVLIGSSTGGVDALLTLLTDFPPTCPPTAIVQHTGKGFSESLIRLLDRRCPARVVQAQDGLVLQPGMVCVAGGTDGHLCLAPGVPLKCQIRDTPPTSGHRPSVDELFRSALPLAPNVVGVLLTGMGQDGAAGLLDLRRAGCATIGQDQATSVVYGMPRHAFEMGAVQQQLPIQQIAAGILRACAADPGARPAVRRPG